MRIESGSSLIQHMQAQQAFRARPPQAAENEPPPASHPEMPKAEPERVPSPQSGLSALPYQDIQEVASKAGFVGITETDIHQAYMRGESLLSDYRV